MAGPIALFNAELRRRMTAEEARVFFGPRVQMFDGAPYDPQVTGVGLNYRCGNCGSNNDTYVQARKCFESHGEADGS